MGPGLLRGDRDDIARRLITTISHEHQRESDEQHGQRQQHAHGEPAARQVIDVLVGDAPELFE